jgi:hypothetical protein
MKRKITVILPEVKMTSGEQLNARAVTNVTRQTPTSIFVTLRSYVDSYADKYFAITQAYNR